MPNFFKLIFVNIFIFALILVAYLYGFVTPIFTNDISHISFVLLLIMVVNLIVQFLDAYDKHNNYLAFKTSKAKWIEFIAGKLFYVGIIGTFIGFIHLVTSLQGMSNVDIVLQTMIVGLLTLFNTTLLGIVAYLWTTFNYYIIESEHE